MKARSLVLAGLAAVFVLGAVAPASAYYDRWRGGWRGGWHAGWRGPSWVGPGWRGYRPWYYGYYGPPRVNVPRVYAPPVYYVAPGYYYPY